MSARLKYGRLENTMRITNEKWIPSKTLDVLEKIGIENIKEEDRVMRLMKTTLKEEREEGIEKGIEKVALEMLKNNADIHFICECTGLTQKELLELKKGLVKQNASLTRQDKLMYSKKSG